MSKSVQFPGLADSARNAVESLRDDKREADLPVALLSAINNLFSSKDPGKDGLVTPQQGNRRSRKLH